MSAVTVTGSNNHNNENSTSKITNKSGNITTFKESKTLTQGLVTIDTLGNEFKVPDYTIKTILDAIPKRCYKRVVATSFFYVFRDIICAITFGTIAQYLIPKLPNVYLRAIAWLGYGILQSLPYTGLWVMAHECGHQAFSDYGWLNDTVGWVLHSYLLVPYFSWKYSHGKHHKATGHLTRDMVFVPPTTEQFKKNRNVIKLSELAADTPIATFKELLIQQVGGWVYYLLTDVTGQPHPELENKWYGNYYASHFNPVSPIFEKRDFWFIILSDLGMLTQFFILYEWIKNFGWFNCMVHWFIPYIFTNHWLVFITFLQHSDTSLPHYEDKEWNFARGAAATIDREFGFVGSFFFHDIIETHVLHHYVSRIPFYNGREGTEAIKKVMGEHYAHSDENMWTSLWKSGRYCQFVEGDGVKMFRNINNLGVAPKKD
jgi:omega-6 fatty acid desaturase (delta-12 desaturase)